MLDPVPTDEHGHGNGLIKAESGFPDPFFSRFDLRVE